MEKKPTTKKTTAPKTTAKNTTVKNTAIKKAAPKRMTRKQRRLLAQKRRQKRIALIACAAAVLCLAIALPIVLHNAHSRPQPDTWIIADGEVEVAAPPLENGIGTLDVIGTLEGSDTIQTLPPFSNDGPGDDFFTSEPDPNEQTDPFAPQTLPPLDTLPPSFALEPTLEPETVSVLITAAGDCTLGGDTKGQGYSRFEKAVKKNGYDFFLANVRSIFEDDDITIVNLEGPLTESKELRPNRPFNFKGHPEYVEILTSASVEVCNVANNHTLDFGRAGLEETTEVLENADIGVSGYDAIHYEQVRGVNVGFIGLTEWDYSAADAKRIVSETRQNCDLLIVSVHWGEEGNYSATSTQKSLGRACIDAGADLVLGHHPHVIGGIEQYNGKYIVYSLGNFCFGGNGNPTDKDTMIFRQRFDIARDGTVSDGGINVIPCSVSSVKNSNNFQPTPLTEDSSAKLMKKIGKYSDVDDPVLLSSQY